MTLWEAFLHLDVGTIVICLDILLVPFLVLAVVPPRWWRR